MYSRVVLEALKKIGAEEGDSIRLFSPSRSYEGVLLPSPQEDSSVLVLKLKNGYNVGVSFEAGSSLEKLPVEKKRPGAIPKVVLPPSRNPGISILACGGTIGTHVDYATGGVFMSRAPEEVLGTTPELGAAVRIEEMASPFTLASEDMQPWHWRTLAEEAARLLNRSETRGIVVTHGTDTLHFTASVLSFMLQGLGKPVAVVGAQRSPDRGSFDGRMNLLCAAYYAGYSDFGEVAAVMHGSASDDFCYAHRGTKVRKMHTSARAAFQSVNDAPLAKIHPDGKIEPLNSRYRKRSDSQVTVDARFEEKTALLKLFPNASPELLDFLVQKGYRGVVLEAFALGHVPTGKSGTQMGHFDESRSWIPAVKRAVGAGMVVAVTSQSLYGRVSPTVYRNLRLLSGAGATFCRDLLPETAYVKLACALGRANGPAAARALLLENWAFEYNDRLSALE